MLNNVFLNLNVFAGLGTADPKDAMIREFHDEIQRLKEQLAGYQGKGGKGGMPGQINP